MKDTIERLNRENQELRRKLAVDEAAQAGTARRLDAAHRRIYELTEEAVLARSRAEAAQQEFEEFRAAYARVLDDANKDKLDLRGALEDARRNAERPARKVAQPFGSVLAEARLGADHAASFVSGTGSGKLPKSSPRPWTA
jgi:hypothetical protein